MRYVVIGASAAGISGAKTLRELDENAEIVLISKDENVYSRCILHHYIEGIRNVKQLDFSEDNFMEKYDINWMKGIHVLKLDSENKVLELSNGENLSYDKVLIASGASSFIPPVENLRTANHVVGLRNLEDAEEIVNRGKVAQSAVVLGAGLVGIDAVSGLMDYDLELSLVEMGDRILPLQLDKYAASQYEERFAKKGVNLKLGVAAQKLIVDENNNPKGLLLNTGEEVPCELVVVATGVRSNVSFLEGSGVECDKFGLIISPKGKTNVKDIYGAGDVTGRNPIWPTAVKEGIIAASNMLGIEKEMTDFFGSKNTMNFVGLATLSLGTVNLNDENKDEYEIEEETDENGYRKILHKDGKIYGALIQGDLSYAGVLTQLIKERIDISKVKKPLFEIDYSDFFNVSENFEYTY
ncbi:NAD(P)/FAD-dependent oxidoreductase [uncultured Clostridium sp.]|uniref:NAD(P)/FAD-dependent oxidoreductase n=1 Tax=uncultured Clostridium sp. TaxID=59620 RepID=UPI00260B5B3C|nr:NAD(P)/FAD-dependent oxidoreductase [uncultured Clostridium sp.]